MAILFIDGFDYYPNSTPTDLEGRWVITGISTGSRYGTHVTTRNGHGLAIRLGSSALLARTFPSASTMHVAFAIKCGSTPSNRNLFQFKNSTTYEWYCTWLSNGKLRIVGDGGANLGESTQVFNANTWYHIAIKTVFSNTVGSVELRVNGSATPDINITNADTSNSNNQAADSFQIQGDTVDFFFDDLVIADDTGSQAFLGDYDVYTIYPDGAGASAQFTPSAGSNWQNVDETPHDGDTTYNESLTVGHKDRFTMQDVPTDTDTIYAVQVGAFAKKTDTGARELNVLAYDGTTEGAGSDILIGTSYGWALGMFEDHPSGAAAWTESEVNSMEAGYEVAV